MINWKIIESYKTGANFYIPQTERMYDKICKEIGREDDEIFDWYYDTTRGVKDLKEILCDSDSSNLELELVESHDDGTSTYTFKSCLEFDKLAAEYYGSERGDETTKKYLENILDVGHGDEVK